MDKARLVEGQPLKGGFMIISYEVKTEIGSEKFDATIDFSNCLLIKRNSGFFVNILDKSFSHEISEETYNKIFNAVHSRSDLEYDALNCILSKHDLEMREKGYK